MGRFSLLWLAVLAASLALGVFALPVEGLLASLPNGSFETFPTGGANDWDWPDSHWVWDSSVAHSGTHSARVYRSSGGETDSLYSPYVTVQASTIYTLSYWLRTRDATWYPSVSIYQYTSSGSMTGLRMTADANIVDDDNEWMRVTYRFQTMPNAAKILLRVFLYTDTKGTFWFDDFSLDQGPAASYPFQAGFPVRSAGWVFFSSPTVVDLDGDGDRELLIGADSYISGWNADGTRLSNFPLATGDRMIVSQIAVGNLDSNPDLEIVAGTRTPVYDGRGRVFAWHHTGSLVSGWPKYVAWNTDSSGNDSWVSSLALGDLDGDQDLEVVAGTTNNASGDPDAGIAVPNLYAWHANGTLVGGNWPNWHTSAGIYGGLAVGDLSGDGRADVFVGRDFYHLYAYAANGGYLSGWPIRTFVNGNDGNYLTDQRIVYDASAPILADLENDGQVEAIVAGSVKGPGDSTTILNSGLLVLKADGTRRSGWGSAALGSGVVAYQTLPRQAPAVADLNKDGKLEIVVATHDGWIRAYKHDKTLLWSFNYAQGEALFASEPVIGDITGDGKLDVIFSTYVSDSDMRSQKVGLWGLTAEGALLSGFPLPFGALGGQSAPTLADLDRDGDVEILAATRDGQLFVWDAPTPYNSLQMPWPTGRHDALRSATYAWQGADFNQTRMFATPGAAPTGGRVNFTIQVITTLPVTYPILLTNTVPSGLSYIPGTLSATAGNVSAAGTVLKWNGSLSKTTEVAITYGVLIDTAETKRIENEVIVDVVGWGRLVRTSSVYANGYSIFLPLIFRAFSSGGS